MKKILHSIVGIKAMYSKLFLLAIAALLFSAGNLSAQVINEGFEEAIWSNFGTGPGVSTWGSVALPNVPANSVMSYLTGGTSFTTATNTCNNSGTWYYSKATSQSSSKYGAGAHSKIQSIKLSSGGFIITPTTPAAVINVIFWAANSSGPLLVGLASDPNAGAQTAAFTYLSSTYPTGITTMQSYSFGGTFSGPCRIGIFNTGGSTAYIDDIQVFAPTGTPPTIVTNPGTQAITSATVGGTVTAGTLPLLQSGIIWSTSSPLTGTAADKSLSKTVDTPASKSTYTDTVSPLSPGTTYYAEAYVIGLDGSFYAGATVQFTTNALSAPLVSTNNPISVLSNKANVSGTVTDSGGLKITKEVINYGTSKGSLTSIANPYPNPSVGTTFPVQISSLQPLTKYYYQACATNSLGTSCGNIDSFTTGAPVPTLTATPNIFAFGDIIFNSTNPIVSYTLLGANLNPGPVTISLSPTTGYLLSTSATFKTSSTSLTINNPSGGKLKQIIYVKFLTNKYGAYNSVIYHSGAGVATQDADSVNLTGNVIPAPDQISNMGTDFWTGFGCEENMRTATSQFDTATGTAKGAHFSLYIATGNQPASVMVELPGIPGSISFPRTVNIPANSVTEVGGFPIGDGTNNNATGQPDSRLYTTGVSSRGIHVYSTNGVPVACWLYDWATNNSAAGAMMFPSNTWNSSYIVQAYGGTTSNTGFPNSFFYVITNDDNTVLTITPTADIIDSASSSVITKAVGGTVKYPKGVPFTITLPHKGDVFNAMGLIDASTNVGYDLTGTIIKTDCNKKIAVFGGNARSLINTATCNGNSSGSDNLIQQMFPKVAWGTKYLTVPTKNMEFNTYRINVTDPTTKVYVNKVLYTTASPTWNATGSFYELGTHNQMMITADKPISVTQFIMPGSSCGGATNGNSGTGDPEMILLSPIQQAIKSATVFCPGFKDGTNGGTYINVIIPRAGVDSFKIDGKTSTSTVDTGTSSYVVAYGTANCLLKNAFVKHAGDTSYRYAKFHVSYPAPHTISSNVPFNAIAYGTSKGESWGFNAGTAIYNLSFIPEGGNPFGVDTSGSSIVRTCKDNLLTLKVSLPYLPSQVDSIVWSTPANANINHPDTSFSGPLMVDPNNPAKKYADTTGSIIINGETFYQYTCQVPLKFSDYGFYPITVTAHGTFVSDCPGVDENKVYVQVSRDNINFSATPAGCGSKNVTFVDSTEAMPDTYIKQWSWDLGDGTTTAIYTTTDSTKKNPPTEPYAYPLLSKYWAKLTTINSIGCFSTDSVYIDLSFGIKVGFTVDHDSICPGTAINFTDTSSLNAASWKWNFGDPTSGANNTSTTQNPTHTYNTSGTYTVTLQVFTAGGCPSAVFSYTVYVASLPKPNFTFGGICLPGGTIFINTSDSATGLKPYTYLWNFGDSPTDTAETNGTHTYIAPVPKGGYSVKLIATNSLGCVDSISHIDSTIYDKPLTSFTISKTVACKGDKLTLTNTSTANNQTIGSLYWDFGDGKNLSGNNPTTIHQFDSIGLLTVRLAVVSSPGGCLSDTVTQTISVNPLPAPAFILPGSCLSAGPIVFTDNSTIDNTTYPTTPAHSLVSWNWNFGDSYDVTGSTAQNGAHTFTNPNPGTYKVIEKVTSSDGCIASDTLSFVISGSRPFPNFYISHKDSLCDQTALTLVDTSRILVGTIGRVDIQWDVVGNSPVITDNNPSNGKVGTGKSYVHTYPSAGTYYIKLTAYAGNNSSGCDSSVTLLTPIVVNPLPVPAFSLPGSCLSNGQITFTDNSTISSGQALHNSWNFGDPGHLPNTDNATNGSHTFKDTGNYTITDTVISIVGCSAYTSQIFGVAGSKPTPSFIVVNGNNLCSNIPVTITDNSRLPIGIIKKVEIYWNYSNGATVPDITDNSPSNGLANSSKNYTHTYPVSGTDITYNVRLVAYSGTTCYQDIIVPITVHGNPKISFSAISDVCLNGTAIDITNEAKELTHLTGSFVFSSTTASAAINGNLFDPTKTAGPNTYPVLATYTTTFGCLDTATQFVKVLALPIAIPSASSLWCENRSITFTDNSNPNGGSINSQTWVINNQVFTGTPVTYTYPISTNDVVRLVVGTLAGCSSDTGKLPLFINPLPDVDFSFPSSVCLPKGTTKFNDLSTLTGTVQPQFTYLWNFGDAAATPSNPNVSILANPSHNYTSTSDYTITLKVISQAGCDSTLSKQLFSSQIHPAPIASMQVVPLNASNAAQVCLGDSISFKDISSGNIIKSAWIFGDGIVDTSTAESHTYSTATSYQAYHVVIDNNNCVSVNNPTVSVLVDALPIVHAGYDKYLVKGDSVVLNEVTVIANDFTNWWTTTPYNLYMNDTAILNPVFAPAESGTYTYTLHVKTKAGCTATDVINLVALDPPYIPNVFSPNGDHIHDTWDISSIAKFPGATIKVFNRYGQLIYNVIGYAKAWDGTVNGSPLPIGTYYYIISPKNGMKDIIGSVTIIR